MAIARAISVAVLALVATAARADTIPLVCSEPAGYFPVWHSSCSSQPVYFGCDTRSILDLCLKISPCRCEDTCWIAGAEVARDSDRIQPVGYDGRLQTVRISAKENHVATATGGPDGFEVTFGAKEWRLPKRGLKKPNSLTPEAAADWIKTELDAVKATRLDYYSPKNGELFVLADVRWDGVQRTVLIFLHCDLCGGGGGSLGGSDASGGFSLTGGSGGIGAGGGGVPSGGTPGGPVFFPPTGGVPPTTPVPPMVPPEYPPEKPPHYCPPHYCPPGYCPTDKPPQYCPSDENPNPVPGPGGGVLAVVGLGVMLGRRLVLRK